MEVLRKRNTATTIYFPLIKAGEQNFATSSDYTPVSGDVQYSVDGGVFANTNTTTPTYEGNGIWSLPLITSEVNGKTTVVTIIDSATKAVEDQAIIISTFGDDSSQISLNAIADFVLKRNMATSRASSDGDGSGRFILSAFSRLRNKVADIGGNTVRVYQEDDNTTEFDYTTTTNPSADPITAIDPS